jgi:Leucine-rich repeat (LRR) protein
LASELTLLCDEDEKPATPIKDIAFGARSPEWTSLRPLVQYNFGIMFAGRFHNRESILGLHRLDPFCADLYGRRQPSSNKGFHDRLEQRLETYHLDEGAVDLSYFGIEEHHVGWLVHRLQALSGLIALNVQGNSLGRVGAAAIAKHLPDLIELNIGGNYIGDEGAIVIAEHLHGLVALNVSQNHIRTPGAVAIANHFPGLRMLHIASNGIDEMAAIALASNLKQLTVLDVSLNQIGSAGTSSIAEHLSSLTALDVSANFMDEHSVFVITERLASLTSLGLRFTPIGQLGAEAIAQHLPNLISLTLDSCMIDATGAFLIAESLSGLTTLRLGNNELGDAGAIAIAERLPRLTDLNLVRNHIGPRSAVAIASHLRELTTLNIWGNCVGDAGVASVAQRLPALTALNAGSNSITDVGAVAVADHAPQLTFLSLDTSRIGDPGAIAISKRLAALKALSLAHSKISTEGAVAIAEKLNALVTLDLGDNYIGDAGVVALKRLTSLKALLLENNSIRNANVVADLLRTLSHKDRFEGLHFFLVDENPLVWPETGIKISQKSFSCDPHAILDRLTESTYLPPSSAMAPTEIKTEGASSSETASPATQRAVRRRCRIDVNFSKKEILLDGRIVKRGSGQLCFIVQRLIDKNGSVADPGELVLPATQNFVSTPGTRVSSALRELPKSIRSLIIGIPGVGGFYLEDAAFEGNVTS